MDKRDSITIDGWQIDANRYRISRDGIEKKLEPRIMELLLYLADHPGQVVTRQQIEDDVWKDRVVGYDVLSGSIAKIRKAFEDTSQNPRIIETIPKSGYRLIAPVLVQNKDAYTYSGNPAAEHYPGKRNFKISRISALGIVIAVISLVIIGFYVLNSGDSETKSTAETAGKHFDPGKPSLAIMPFKNMSNDPGQSVYSDGLTDDLITDLSNIEGLQVTPRHSSFIYATKKISPLEIARELRVRYIVQGSLRRSFDDIRVNVQLVDTQINQEIWAQRFDDSIESIFNLQDQIINQILRKLDLDPGTKPHSKRRTTSLEAYDFFLRAEHRRLNGRPSARDSKTLDFYRRAIELDPSFVAAYTGLAREALGNWQNDETRVMPSAVWKKLIYKTAGKALELDPENAEALAILGLLQVVSGEHDVGIASVKSAVAINPGNPQLHVDLAIVLSYGGAHQEALQSINNAINQYSAPPATYIRSRAYIYFFLGQFENALKDIKSVPDIRNSTYISILIYGAMNDRKAAKPYVDASLNWYAMDNQEYYRINYSAFRRPQDIELVIDSANKAGVPRYPYGYDPGESNLLDNTSISELTRKGLWRGKTQNGLEF
ncbi:MAG: winged helix-turn-helix domain-containing protein, partial [Proteobacteria bacterium]|nr:winged helix-turn-helix domain-containing protein [Pseudomonadota bacterium]